MDWWILFFYTKVWQNQIFEIVLYALKKNKNNILKFSNDFNSHIEKLNLWAKTMKNDEVLID